MLPLIRFCIVLAVPITSHLAVALSLPILRIAAVMLLALAVLLPYWQKAFLWLGFAVLAAVLVVFPSIADVILAALPVLVMMTIGSLFARSLLPNRMPLVTAMASAIRRETRPDEILPAKISRYCRGVTWLWAVTLFSMATVNLLLALFASQQQWSAFANIGSPLIIGPLFVIEFLVRCWWLKGFWHPNFREFVAGMRRLNYRQLLQ